MQTTDYLCKIENLILMYGGGRLLLKNTCLKLARGHRYGIVGANGAGKTTLMNLISMKQLLRVSSIPLNLNQYWNQMQF